MKTMDKNIQLISTTSGIFTNERRKIEWKYPNLIKFQFIVGQYNDNA